MKFIIKNKVFEIKTLKLKNINLNYVRKTSNEYINFKKKTIKDQKKYVKELRKSHNEIYQIMYKNLLIATSGFQFNNSKTYQGLLIIDNNFLGKGMAKYFIYSSIVVVNKSLKKKIFYANIEKKNKASLKSFIGAGYKIINKSDNSLNLKLDIKQKNLFLKKNFNY